MASEFEDDLLALAEPRDADGRPRKKKRASAGSPSKKPKAEDMDSDSGSAMDIESEEDDTIPAQYPLEGKYVDEVDRSRLMALPELEREQILEGRLEEIQKWKDRIELKNMLKRQSGMAVDDDDSGGKRKPGARDKLDKYKAERKAKEERRQARRDRPGSPESPNKPHRRGSFSDDESDRGEDTRDSRTTNRKIVIEDLQKIRLSRRQIMNCHGKPWFKDYLAGAYVRYLIEGTGVNNTYRVCRINKLCEARHPYHVEGKKFSESAELQHGKAVREFTLDKVSNDPFTDREFDRFVTTHKVEKVDLPTLADIARKEQELSALADRLWTDKDVAEHLAKKREQQGGRLTQAHFAVQRNSLRSAIGLAERRGDSTEVTEIKIKLEQLEMHHIDYVDTQKRPREEETEDLVAKVNKRNRLANEEAIKRAEAVEAERRRQRRAQNLTARTQPGTPVKGTNLPPAASLPVAPPTHAASSYDEVVNHIEVDLGDF